MITNGRRVSRTILVIDDNPMHRAMIARTLRNGGLDVLVAQDGYQGIGVLSRRSRDIALLIVDTEMPGVHGWEVIRFARMKAPEMRVVRLGRPEDPAPGLEYQVFQRLPSLAKPVSHPALLAAVQGQLKKSVLE